MTDVSNFIGAITLLEAPPTPSLRQYRVQIDTSDKNRKGPPLINMHVASLAGEGGYVENGLKLEAAIEGTPGDETAQESMWEGCMADNVRDCVYSGINASILVLGPMMNKNAVILDPAHGLLQKVVEGIHLTQKMITVGAELSTTMTCLELNSEKVRDVLAKDREFSEKKVRGARPYVDGLRDLPVNAENVAFVQSQVLKDEHSTLIINHFYKIKDCGIIKNSCVTLALIPRHLERPNNFPRSDGPVNPAQRLGASNVNKVLQANTEVAQKRKTRFVPYKDSIVTLMLSEPLGNGSFKTFLVACLSEECYEAESMKEENITVIKMVSKARSISMALKTNEEEVSLLDIKSEMATLKKKLADAAATNESSAQKKEATLEIQSTIKQQLEHLEATRADKNAEYAKLKIEREKRDEELRRIQDVLNSKKLAAADAIKAQEELEMLERYQDETDRKMIEEERLRVEREAELQEALELEVAITKMKKEQDEREAEARATAKEAQASTMVALFRAAHNLTRDRAAMVSVKAEISALVKREEEIEVQLENVERKVKLASNHRYSVKAMFETCGEQETKLKAARTKAQEVHVAHIQEYTAIMEQMGKEEALLKQRIEEIGVQISAVAEELSSKRTEERAFKRQDIKQEIADLNAKAEELRESAAGDRQIHSESFQVLPGQRRQIAKIKMSVRTQELTEEELDRERHALAKVVDALEVDVEKEESRLETDQRRFVEAKELRQHLVNERAFLSRNHAELEKYVTVRHNKLGEFDRNALQAALRAQSESHVSSSSRGGSRQSRTPARSPAPGTPRSNSRPVLTTATKSLSPVRHFDPEPSTPNNTSTTGHPMRNASALLRRINNQVEKRHPPTPRAQRLQL